jgi:acetyltransferase-like isoleucine patch superfamily enzyme
VRHSNHRPRFTDPLALLSRGLTKLYSIWVSFVYPFASKGRNLSFHFASQVDRQRSVRISIGNSVRIEKDAWLNVATEDPTGEPVIVIDDNCSIGYGTMISAKNRVHLERDVLVGQQVTILDHNHAYEDIMTPIACQGITEGGRVRIGQGSWIGRGSAIICARGELTIGRHCVVSVNSMVMRSIPDYSVVFGSPATIIRQYDPETRAWRMSPRGNRDMQSPEAVSVPISE